MISHNSKLRIVTATFLAATLWALLFYCSPILFSIIILCMMCIMIIELKNMVRNLPQFLLLAPLYPIIPCLILIYLHQTPDYKILVPYLFLLIFSFDSVSYLAGSACSKFWTTHKIIPAISPGKSWEGAIGGYLSTTLILLIALTLQNKIYDSSIFIITAIICTIAFAGDIFESYLKRSANLKDSGTLLPGHGGFLDRFDAILFVSYFFFIFKDPLLKILTTP